VKFCRFAQQVCVIVVDFSIMISMCSSNFRRQSKCMSKCFFFFFFFAAWSTNFQSMMKKSTKCIFDVNHTFKISTRSYMFRRLRSAIFRKPKVILPKFCVCYVISAVNVKVGTFDWQHQMVSTPYRLTAPDGIHSLPTDSTRRYPLPTDWQHQAVSTPYLHRTFNWQHHNSALMT
jgi:hypothetical protein